MSLQLPIDIHLEKIKELVEHSQVTILSASPGSGKTLRVPIYLSKTLSQKVLVLEPRRLAAKLSAERVAYENKLQMGQEVGHWFRFEKKISSATQLIYLTEGTFLKWYENDRNIDGFSILILDEFHERHLETDLSLALTLNKVKENKLKLVIMSATIDIAPLLSFFEKHNLKTQSIEIKAPPNKLHIEYLNPQDEIIKKDQNLKVAHSIERFLHKEGDILVFLPGLKQMQEVKVLIEQMYENIDCLILHGSMSVSDQTKVFELSKNKKIILATNIAESSITVPNVRSVIDLGVHREASYSPWKGIDILETVKSSKFSLIQRAGRANREADGQCLRLMTQLEFDQRAQNSIPSIHREDLSEAIVLTSVFGEAPNWFEAPKAERWLEMKQDLIATGILLEDGTPCKEIEELRRIEAPLAYAKVLWASKDCSESERNIVKRMVATLIDPTRMKDLFSRWEKTLPKLSGKAKSHEWAFLQGILPQISLLKNNQFFTYKGSVLKIHQELQKEIDHNHSWWIILESDHLNRAHQALPIEEEWLLEFLPFPFNDFNSWSYSESKDRFEFKQVTKIGKITFEESELKDIPENELENLSKLLAKRFEQTESSTFQDQRWKRIIFVLSDNNMKSDWTSLIRYCPSAVQTSPTQTLSLLIDLLEYFVESELKLKLDQLYPLQIKNKDKSLKIDWNSEHPSIDAYIQYFYGMSDAFVFGTKSTPYILKLLGPHSRPLQTTKDLKSFWTKTYQELAPELKREYPRHYWPNNPESAFPHLLKRHAEEKK